MNQSPERTIEELQSQIELIQEKYKLYEQRVTSELASIKRRIHFCINDIGIIGGRTNVARPPTPYIIEPQKWNRNQKDLYEIVNRLEEDYRVVLNKSLATKALTETLLRKLNQELYAKGSLGKTGTKRKFEEENEFII